MKRMYVTLGVMFLLVLWAFSCLGQQSSRPLTQQEKMMKRMQMREEIHRRILEQFMKGGTPPDDMFADMEKLMDETMSEAFSGMENMNSLAPRSNHFSMEWSENSSGRTLAITPKTPEQQLNIDVKKGVVSISGKVEERGQNGVHISEFNNSVTVPHDCDSSKVKMNQKEGKILLEFPYVASESTPKVPKVERIPVPPSKNDVEI